MRWTNIVLIVLLLVYILSPVDLISDFLPITGWLDDGLLLGLLVYYLKTGKLPPLFGRRAQPADTPGAAGRSTRPPSPYEILGLKPGAAIEEVHSAYRKAAQAYHPDKVAHLGPELQALAREKFIEIQTAYETLTRKSA